MAAKFDKDMLVKQHFWLLLGPLMLFVLLALVFVMTGVADATSERLTKIEEHKKELESTKGKSQALLKKLDEQREQLYQRRTAMWEKAWDQQKSVFTWPAGFSEDQLAKVRNLKFGADLDGRAFDDIRTQFRDDRIYRKEYETLAESVAPTQFAGGWQAVLRHVDSWVKVPTGEDIWLALEDLWVEREMLSVIRQVNEDAARFALVGDPKDKLGRTFRSRVWDLELKMADRGGDRVLGGKIRNRTERVQPIAVDKVMVLKVWVTRDDRVPPFELKVEGEFAKAGQEIVIKEQKLDPDVAGRANELFRVEQVFDGRTVPVKRIDKLALGYASDRTFSMQLKMSKFSREAADAEAKAAGTGASPTPKSGPGPMGTPMSGMPPGGPPGGPGYPGAGNAAAANPNQTANHLERARYLDTTDQVRRLPLGMVVIIDQAYIQDVLVGVANSRLRFQTTQMHWSRSRGAMSYAHGTTLEGESAPGNIPFFRGPPMPNFGPPGKGPSGPPRTGPGKRPPAMPGYDESQPGMFNPASRSDDPLAGSLVELSVYGIASLYERYTKEAATPGKKDASAPPGKGPAVPPKGGPTAGPTPGPTPTPAPKSPMNPAAPPAPKTPTPTAKKQ